MNEASTIRGHPKQIVGWPLFLCVRNTLQIRFRYQSFLSTNKGAYRGEAKQSKEKRNHYSHT